MKILVNFASPSFSGAQKDNSKLGREVAHFDQVLEYTPGDLPEDFNKRNATALSHEKGCGYWVWLPHILLDALNRTQPGDYIFYCNSGATWLNNIQYLVDELEGLRTFALLFYSYDEKGVPLERYLTKRDTFILMDCDTPEYTDTTQLFAGYLLLKNCFEARNFLLSYQNYCEDFRILLPGQSIFGKEDYQGFREHMSNQSILSLLAKKWKLPISTHMPDQFRRPQIIQYDRRKY